MAFPQSFLDELAARTDIVDVVGSYVQLTRRGSNLFGLCPFHSEKTGSFSVSPDKQIYYCFGSWPSGRGSRCRRRRATGRPRPGGSASWT